MVIYKNNKQPFTPFLCCAKKSQVQSTEEIRAIQTSHILTTYGTSISHTTDI